MPENSKPAPRSYAYNKEYARRYMAQQATVKLYMHPDKKAEITAAAQRAGESVNQYILTAVQTRIDSETDETTK